MHGIKNKTLKRRYLIMNTDKIYAEAIVNEYSKKSATKVVQLKKLDRAAKLPAQIFTYTFGIICALVAGVGMCLCMGVIGEGTTASMIMGLVIGIIGFIGTAVNYPIYKSILQKSKDKYAGDIIRLAREIADSEK